MRDEIRSAYAALGLEPGAALFAVKRRFKALVRTWHPDLFVTDPQGLAEANHRLRIINQAYNTILAADFRRPVPQMRRDPPASVRQDGGPGRAQATDASPPERPVSTPLTPEQIDEIIEAMKSRGRRPSIREQIRDQPWNRGLSLGVAGSYVLQSAWAAWRNPWPMVTAWHVKPTLPATGPMMASMVMSGLLLWPFLYVIWYSENRTRVAGWVCLTLLPAFGAMMRW
jgi:curved DNA-binding protein CbpA